MGKRLFRISFKDGDKKLFEASTMTLLLNHLLFVLNADVDNIIKIEEV